MAAYNLGAAAASRVPRWPDNHRGGRQRQRDHRAGLEGDKERDGGHLLARLVGVDPGRARQLSGAWYVRVLERIACDVRVNAVVAAMTLLMLIQVRMDERRGKRRRLHGD